MHRRAGTPEPDDAPEADRPPQPAVAPVPPTPAPVADADAFCSLDHIASAAVRDLDVPDPD